MIGIWCSSQRGLSKSSPDQDQSSQELKEREATAREFCAEGSDQISQ